MLRRSSKRAFSSTRQTLCFPSSAASISAGTTGESSLVRYTVVRIPITSGSFTALRTKASTLVVKESYGSWINRSPFATSSKKPREEARRGWVTGPHGSSCRSGRSMRRHLHQVGEIEHPADRVHLIRRDVQALLELIEHRLRHLL